MSPLHRWGVAAPHSGLRLASSGSPVVVLTLLVLLVGVFWIHRIELPRSRSGSEWTHSDRSAYSHPVAAMVHRELRRGALPLWNPYQMAGQPFLAGHAPALLYPPNLLVLLALPERPALSLLAVLHLVLGGMFTWLFAARVGLAPGPRLAVAAVYTIGYPAVLAIGWPHILATQTWLPAILWATHGLVSEVRPRWSLALAAFLALAFLAGDAQGFLYEAELGCAYGAFALVFLAKRGTRARVLAFAGLSGLVAAGLAAPQILPSLELASRSVRGLDGLSLDQAAFGSLSRSQLLRSTLGPFLIGDPPAAHVEWSHHQLLVWPALALPLLPFGLLAKRRRSHWLFFAAAALVCGLYITGPRGSPVFTLHHSLPFGALFRLPLRMAFVYMLFVGMLLGVGLQGLLDLLERRSRSRLGAWLGALAALATVLDLYARLDIPKGHIVIAPLSKRTPPELLDVLVEADDRRRAFLEVGIGHPSLVAKAGTLNGFFALPDYESSMPSEYEDYFNAAGSRIWHGNLGLSRSQRTRDARELGVLLDLMSVGHYVAPLSKMRNLTPGMKPLAGTRSRKVANFLVATRPSALPRAYTVECVQYEEDFESSLNAILAPAFRPRAQATVTAAEAGAGDPALEASCAAPRALEPATITSFDTAEVVVEARCESACLLVLTDLFYPGWRATVDRAPATILRANALFRGVILERGEHEVVQRFQPSSFRIGLAMCAAAAVTVFLLTRSWR